MGSSSLKAGAECRFRLAHLYGILKNKCTILENENVKEKCFKELKKTLLQQKYP